MYCTSCQVFFYRFACFTYYYKCTLLHIYQPISLCILKYVHPNRFKCFMSYESAAAIKHPRYFCSYRVQLTLFNTGLLKSMYSLLTVANCNLSTAWVFIEGKRGTNRSTDSFSTPNGRVTIRCEQWKRPAEVSTRTVSQSYRSPEIIFQLK